VERAQIETDTPFVFIKCHFKNAEKISRRKRTRLDKVLQIFTHKQKEKR
jgi:hypothetical protein